MNKDLPPDAATVIDRLGGTSAVARLCQCKVPSVSDWKKYGIPKARVLYLRAIRPDVFAPIKREAA